MISLLPTEEPRRFVLAGGVAARVGVVLTLGLVLLVGRPVRGQVDTTATGPDSTQRPPAAPSGSAGADTTEDAQGRLRPLSFAPSPYGRPTTDSLPGRLPHISIELILAEQPGSFLYDLGPAGWPHGWSHRGLPPHRAHLWVDGLPFDDPLTGRPRFELVPPSFVEPPGTGIDPGGGGLGVHTSWRDYEPKRPVTELRYRVDNNGLHAIEVAHSQKRRLDLFGRPGVMHATFGYGGRKAIGVYSGSDLRRERKIWARLRYQTNEWAFELADRSSRYRIGAHGVVEPVGERFESIYDLPVAATSVQNPSARRRTFRNDLTARVRGPLLPATDALTDVSVGWTSNTFDFQSDFEASDTTWTARLNGGHAKFEQPLRAGAHDLTLSARGSVWGVDDTNVPQLNDSREELHLLVRDSLRLGAGTLVADLGAHWTSNQWFPSARLWAQRRAAGFGLSASVRLAGQRTSWFEQNGFAGLLRPRSATPSGIADRLVEGTVAVRTSVGPVGVRLQAFAHQIRNARDLYAPVSTAFAPATPNTVAALRTTDPVRRAGATLSLDWRRNARRGLYASVHGSWIEFLNPDASPRHHRLSRTLPSAFGQARLGARFVIFQELVTDLYVRGRMWSEMNSRWFHPATGRLVVPPRRNPVPAAPGRSVGPSATVDVRAETQLRDATLFFTFENVQAGTSIQNGTFVVPVYPLPAQQFRFGVFWPIFD